MDWDVETFMIVTGASRSQALHMLQENGGDLNVAVNTFFNEAKNIECGNYDSCRPPKKRDDSHPISQIGHGKPAGVNFLNQTSFLSVDPFWSPFNSFSTLDRRFFLGDVGSYNSSSSDQMKNKREILIDWKDENLGQPRKERVPYRPSYDSGPQVSHPKDVKEIVIDWKDNDDQPSNAPHIPIIEEIPEDEHGVYEAGLEGNVTVVDDDIPNSASNDSGNIDVNSDCRDLRNGVLEITEIPLTASVGDEQKLLQTVIEALKKEAEEAKRSQQHDINEGKHVSTVFPSSKDVEREFEDKRASILPEPPEEEKNAVNVLVRMPDGTTLSRRFLGSNKLQFLFDFIDVASGIERGNYRLLRSCPRHLFTRDEGNYTLNELGLTNKQEALFLES